MNTNNAGHWTRSDSPLRLQRSSTAASALSPRSAMTSVWCRTSMFGVCSMRRARYRDMVCARSSARASSRLLACSDRNTAACPAELPSPTTTPCACRHVISRTIERGVEAGVVSTSLMRALKRGTSPINSATPAVISGTITLRVRPSTTSTMASRTCPGCLRTVGLSTASSRLVDVWTSTADADKRHDALSQPHGVITTVTTPLSARRPKPSVARAK